MNTRKSSKIAYYGFIGIAALAALAFLSWLLVEFVLPVLFFIAALGWLYSALDL